MTETIELPEPEDETNSTEGTEDAGTPESDADAHAAQPPHYVL